MGPQLQTSALPDRLRVGEALRLFARLAGDRVDWRKLAEEWRLEDLLRKPFGTLSGGQRQRLFLALTMAGGPRVAIGEIKLVAKQGLEMSLESALALEREGIFRLFETADAKEGLAAFAEKRKPTWKGE